MLQTLRVQNFKGIKDVIIELEGVNVLIGSNNAGKSSVLQALQFAVSVAQSIGLEGTVCDREKVSGTLSSQQLLYSPLRDVYALSYGGQLKQGEQHAIKITLVTDDLGSTEIGIQRGKNKNISISIEGQNLGRIMQDLGNPFSVFVPGLAGIPVFEEFKGSGLVRRATARGDANSVFRNVLWLLHQKKNDWDSFLVDIKGVFPSAEIDLRFNPEVDEHINTRIKMEGIDLPIDSSGTGLLQAIQILAYVNHYRPKILILDEPDSHLHPNNQRKIAKLLTKIWAERNVQIILSTHSRHLLDEFSNGGAKINWLSSGGVIANENNDRMKILLDLGALDIGDRLKQGDLPCVVLTEDTDINPLHKVLVSSGVKLDKNQIWSYEGCSNIKSALILARFIRDHAPATTIIIHRDRDYDTEEVCQTFVDRLNQPGVCVFLTDGVDIESHFLSAEHINHVLPDIGLHEVSALISLATQDVENDSKKAIVNARVAAASRERNQKGGDPVDYGIISASAYADYDNDNARYRHGKTVLKRLKMHLQQRLKKNIDIFQVSPYLENMTLKDISNRL